MSRSIQLKEKNLKISHWPRCLHWQCKVISSLMYLSEFLVASKCSITLVWGFQPWRSNYSPHPTRSTPYYLPLEHLCVSQELLYTQRFLENVSMCLTTRVADKQPSCIHGSDISMQWRVSLRMESWLTVHRKAKIIKYWTRRELTGTRRPTSKLVTDFCRKLSNLHSLENISKSNLSGNFQTWRFNALPVTTSCEWPMSYSSPVLPLIAPSDQEDALWGWSCSW